MNGDTSGTMGEPINIIVQNKQGSMSEPKKMNSESGKIGTCCENSHTDNGNYENGHLMDVKSNNSDEVFVDDQDIETDNTDHTQKFAQNKKKKDTLADCKDGDGDSGEKGLQGDFTSENDEYPEDRNRLDDKTNNYENSIDDDLSQGDAFTQDEETKNSHDDNPYLSDQETGVNELTHNRKSDESSGEDTVGDTMSSGETERERQQNITDTLHSATPKMETFKIVDLNRHHSDDEIGSVISSDDCDSEEEPLAEDALSINSDSDGSTTGDLKKDKELFILGPDGTEKQTGILKTTEIHEIEEGSDNDDCVMTVVEKIPIKMISPVVVKTKKGPKAIDTNLELRRSSRTIKRKKYDDDMQALDDESDIEEVTMEDPMKHKSKQFCIKNTKMYKDTEKQSKPKNNQKKLTTVVIIDSPTKNRTSENKMANSNQSIYQRIAARGTSVTPVTTKNMSTEATQSVSPPSVTPLLPTLTDEMYVVEAPSFIVPYVYEKPAVIPFKEFVDKLGKELEEEKAIEEKELLDKKKEEKAKQKEEIQEKSEKCEEGVESGDEIKKKKADKAVRKERRRRKKEDDDVSWDGSSSDDSEDDTISDEDSQAILMTDKADCIKEIKDAIDPAVGPATKSGSYFDLSLGKFFMDIGLNLATEYVQTDLLNQQNRKLQKELKAGHNTNHRQVSIALLTRNLEQSQESNNSFIFEQKKCQFCAFKTESALAMANHMETPHMKNNQFKCNFCPFEIRSPHDILYHMDKEHGVRGKLERTPAPHQCPNCPFEDHGKGKLARHLIACAKKFKPPINCAPPMEWEHPAKITKALRPRNSATTYPTRYIGDNNMVTNVRIPIVNALHPLAPRPRGQNPVWRPQHPIPVLRTGGAQASQSPAAQPRYTIPNNKKPMNNSISITALPRQSGTVQSLQTANAKGFVMCEICDGYIKDLEQLRNHMQWIHKVKIHPKMIYNRPPLNCQKCQFRFFTDQGLERHLLGSHGLVTSSIQEAANRGKDSGRCPVCGRVYQWKLLVHVSRDHNLFLKPAHLSYKCTVCTATFALYRQFENHVYSVHSVVAKKVIEKKSGSATARANANDIAAKQLKINNEITITPQPAKMSISAKGK